eukprot:TRINITY_DN4281_c0_g1_i1.p1 TRINITY_DN4281_c0_g1~~TRINITY_DN4281_c0_g1_i1.p1  ORF type:complete len:418 (-),score=89.70 TRINITY_DN4281_c0_g1_i1:492-1745(-)
MVKNTIQLLSFAEANKRSKFVGDNEFILSSYRELRNWKDAVRSILRVHNETINIWSHLLGWFLFLALLIQVLLVGVPFASQVLVTPIHIEEPQQQQCQIASLMANESCLFLENGRHTSLLMAIRHATGADYNIDLSIFEQKPYHYLTTCVSEYFQNASVLRNNADIGGDSLEEMWNQLILQSEKIFDEGLEIVSEGLNEFEELMVEGGNTILASWPVFVFLLSAMACLSLSCSFHCFNVINEEYYSILAKLDYAGISILIAGSGCPVIYYAFYCDTLPMIIHLCVDGSLCLACVVLSFYHVFQTAKYRPIRALVYVLSGLYGAIPVFHLMASYGSNSEEVTVIYWKLILMGGLYIGGAVLYALRIPERFSPGHFDILFSSHQIFHVMVVLAALTHYWAVFNQYGWRLENLSCEGSIV